MIRWLLATVICFGILTAFLAAAAFWDNAFVVGLWLPVTLCLMCVFQRPSVTRRERHERTLRHIKELELENYGESTWNS